MWPLIARTYEDFFSLCILGGYSFAADLPANPKPTLSDVPYGEHERQVLDFWKAGSSRPTPLLFFIHGGGWRVGDKTNHLTHVADYLGAGISVVSINYRYLGQAHAAGVKAPVQWPLHDAARRCSS